MTKTIEFVPSTEAWGPLAEPVHPDAAGPDDPVWKDNSYIAYWDLEHDIYGSFHVSTSPNAAGARRARCSLLVDGRKVEIIEDLDAGTFSSASISYGLDGSITVDHPELTAKLVNAPLLGPTDYSEIDLIPPLVPGKPLQHFQSALTIRGSVEVAGRSYEVDGIGLRDRTWGFRDEAAQWIEYAGLVGVFDGVFVSVIKFLKVDGTQAASGYLVDGDGRKVITDLKLRRNAAAQFLAGTITLDDGTSRTVTLRERKAGFWVPMGSDTDGPSFGTYDQFMALEMGGVPGGGFVEQGIVHKVH